MRSSVALLVLLLTGCTTSPRQAERTADAEAATREALGAELAGLVPGEPTTCLPLSGRTQLSSKAYGATIVYAASPTLKYRTDTTGGCERLGRGDILITSTPQARVCRGDIATTVDPTSRFQTGTCALGDFVPYRRP